VAPLIACQHHYGSIAQSFGDPLPGVDMVISKPFLMKDLLEAVAKVMSGI